MNILNLSYNQLATHLFVCTDKGYMIYSLNNNIKKHIFKEKNGGIGIMKNYHKSGVHAIVGGGDAPFKSPNNLVLGDGMSNKHIVEFDFGEPIRNILLCRDNIIVVFNKRVCIFNFDGILKDAKPTYNNPKGLCAINLEEKILAFPGTKVGSLIIWNPLSGFSLTIQAHDSYVNAIAMNNQGTLVAVVSGKLIRVLDTKTGGKVHEFKRDDISRIYDICFDSKSTCIACYDKFGTVHIFGLIKKMSKTNKVILSTLTETYSILIKDKKVVLQSLDNYLPYFDTFYKKIKIDSLDRKAICAFDENDVLHVTTFDGKYFRISGEEFENVSESKLD